MALVEVDSNNRKQYRNEENKFVTVKSGDRFADWILPLHFNKYMKMFEVTKMICKQIDKKEGILCVDMTFRPLGQKSAGGAVLLETITDLMVRGLSNSFEQGNNERVASAMEKAMIAWREAMAGAVSAAASSAQPPSPQSAQTKQRMGPVPPPQPPPPPPLPAPLPPPQSQQQQQAASVAEAAGALQANPDLRPVSTETEALERLEGELREATAQVGRLKDQLKTAGTDLQAARVETQAEKTHVGRLEGELGEATAQVGRLKDQLKTALHDKVEQERRAGSAEARLLESEQILVSAMEELDALRASGTGPSAGDQTLTAIPVVGGVLPELTMSAEVQATSSLDEGGAAKSAPKPGGGPAASTGPASCSPELQPRAPEPGTKLQSFSHDLRTFLASAKKTVTANDKRRWDEFEKTKKPRGELRDEGDATPARSGLDNLGQTCYLNSAIQCLYRIGGFRSGIYQWAAGTQPSKPESVYAQLVCAQVQQVFARLQHSAGTVCETFDILRALGLANDELGEVDDFLGKLLGQLDEALKLSEEPVLKNLVPTYFESEVLYTQSCSGCKNFHSSDKGTTNLLMLSVSHQSVEAALKAYLNDETGPIWCAGCDTTIVHRRVGAFRRLPIVLCLGVDRARESFSTKGRQVKVTDQFSFPERLVLECAPPNDLQEASRGHGGDAPRSAHKAIYRLSAMVVHTGLVTDHGHFVATVREREGDVAPWLSADDETVSEVFFAGGKGVRKPTGVTLDIGSTQQAGQGTRYSSKSVRLLVYTRDDGVAPAAVGAPSASGAAAGANAEAKAPASLLAKIREENAELRRRFAAYEEASRAHEEWTRARGEEFANLFPDHRGPARLEGAETRWIHSGWLWRWLTRTPDDKVEAISNAAIACEHGSADPRHMCTGHMQLIPFEAWTTLRNRCGGSPELRADVCTTCADAEKERREREVVSRALQRECSARLLARGGLLEPSTVAQATKFYLLDGAWIADWRRAMESDATSGPGRLCGASRCECSSPGLLVDPRLVLLCESRSPVVGGHGAGSASDEVSGRQGFERDTRLGASVRMATEEEARVLARECGVVNMDELPHCNVDWSMSSVVSSDPPVCATCSAEHGAKELRCLLEYKAAPVRYEQLGGLPSGSEELLRKERGDGGGGEQAPAPKRVRRSAPLLLNGVVSADAIFTVADLKERICYGTRWLPKTQRLFIDGRELRDDGQTLVEAGVFPNSLVQVVVVGVA